MSVLPSHGQEQPYGSDDVTPATRELVDAEVRRLLDECCAEAVDTLHNSRDRLDRLARELLIRETLEEDEAYAAAEVPPSDAAGAVAPGETPGTDRAPGTPSPAVTVRSG